MKPRLFVVIACTGIALVWYTLASSRGLAPPQEGTEWAGHNTRTFTHSISFSSDSYPYHGHVASSCDVLLWDGESNAELVEFRITSPASEMNWSTVLVNAPASNVVRFGSFDEGIGTFDETYDSYSFVAYTPVTRTTTSIKVDANLTRGESGNTWFEPSINLSTGGNELVFNWTTDSTNRHRKSCVSHVSPITALTPPSDGGGALLAIGTDVSLTPVDPTGG